MSEFLFAYGTLRPGLAPAEMRGVVAKLMPVGEGSVCGTLYDLGQYPGVVLGPVAGTTGKIYGTVFRLPDDEDLLRELDAYEEFDPESPEASQFVRLTATVELAAGGTLDCWIYVYNRSTESARVLAGGRFDGPVC